MKTLIGLTWLFVAALSMELDVECNDVWGSVESSASSAKKRCCIEPDVDAPLSCMRRGGSSMDVQPNEGSWSWMKSGPSSLPQCFDPFGIFLERMAEHPKAGMLEGNLKEHLSKTWVVHTDYSGMGCPEMALMGLGKATRALGRTPFLHSRSCPK